MAGSVQEGPVGSNGTHYFSIGIGNYRNFTATFTPKAAGAASARLRPGQFRNSLFQITWRNRYGYRSWIAIGTAIELSGKTFKIQLRL